MAATRSQWRGKFLFKIYLRFVELALSRWLSNSEEASDGCQDLRRAASSRTYKDVLTFRFRASKMQVSHDLPSDRAKVAPPDFF